MVCAAGHTVWRREKWFVQRPGQRQRAARGRLCRAAGARHIHVRAAGNTPCRKTQTVMDASVQSLPPHDNT